MQAFICLKLFFEGVIRIQLQILFIMINLSLEKPPGWRKANFLNGKNIFSTNIFHEFQFIIKIEIIVLFNYKLNFYLKFVREKLIKDFLSLKRIISKGKSKVLVMNTRISYNSQTFPRSFLSSR